MRLAFSSVADNLWTFCVLNKQISVGFARAIRGFLFHVFKRVERTSRDPLYSFMLKYTVNSKM